MTLFRQPLRRGSLGFAIFLLAAGFVGCDSDSSDVESPSLQAPQNVVRAEVPEPVAPPAPAYTGSDRMHYLILDGRSDRAGEVQAEGPEQILEDLLARDVGLEEAWYPVMESVAQPCGAPNVYPALVVRLGAARSTALGEADFVSDPGALTPPVHANCGVEKFEHYTFE